MKYAFAIALLLTFNFKMFGQEAMKIIKSDLAYDLLFNSKEGMLRFKKNNKFGFLDKTGTEVIPPLFTDALDFKFGVALVKNETNWGIINKSGKWNVQPKYKNLFNTLPPPLFAYKDPTFDLIGVKDYTGKEILGPSFIDIIGNRNFICGTRDRNRISTGDGPIYALYNLKGKNLLPGGAEAIILDDLSNIAIAKKGNSNKIIDAEGNLTCDTLNNYEMLYLKKNLIVVKNKQSGFYGICDSKGRMIVNCNKYSFIRPEKDEDLFQVEVKSLSWGEDEKKMGFINLAGTEVLPPKYFYVSSFNGGLCRVKEIPTAKEGFVNNLGKLVIPTEFDAANDFTNRGVAKVTMVSNNNQQEFYINKKGQNVGNKNEDFPELFEGVGLKKIDVHLVIIDKNKNRKEIYGLKDQGNISEGLFSANNFDNKYGFVDLNGNVSIPFNYDYVGSMKDGMARIAKNILVSNNWIKRYGYINKSGVEILAGKLAEADDFSNGYALVTDEKSKKYFINKAGEKQQLQKEYVEVFPFKNGFAMGKLNAEVKGYKPIWVFLNNKFQEVKSIPARSVIFFSDGVLLTRDYDYKIYNQNFIETGSFKSENIDSFKNASEGLFAFREKKANMWGFKNIKGETVIQPQFASVAEFHEGLCAALTASGWKYIDNRGIIKIKNDWEEAGSFYEGLAKIKKFNFYGYIDKAGKIWLEPAYKRATDFNSAKSVLKVESVYNLISR